MTIRKRGATWQAIVRVKQNGQQYEDSRTFATERLAKDWKARTLAHIKLNGIPQHVKSSMTLGDLLLEHRRIVHEVKPMRRQMQWELAQLAEEFNTVKLTALSAKVFTEFARRRALAGTGPATVKHNLATVRAVLNAAHPLQEINVNGDCVTSAINALVRVGIVSNSSSRDRIPTETELASLRTEFKRISNHPSTILPMVDIMNLAVSFPRRLSELTAMRWDDYTGTQVTLRDTKHPTKVRTEVVPVPQDAAAIIATLPKFDAAILPYKEESVSASWQRACKRLGIIDLHFHDLRHCGISRLFAAGLDIPEVALISGHQSWTMLRRYTQLTPATVLTKLNRNQDASRKETQKAATESE